MRALVIAPQPFFSPRGTPYSVYYRTLVTSELGVEVDLLTYGEGEDVDIPGVRIYRIPRFGAFGNVKTGPSLLKLFLDGFILARAVALLCRTRYAFVHAHEASQATVRLQARLRHALEPPRAVAQLQVHGVARAHPRLRVAGE